MSTKPSTWTRGQKVWGGLLAIVIVVGMSVWLLLGLQRRAFAERTHCVGNLVHIRLAKLACQDELGIVDGDPIPEQALAQVLTRDLGKSQTQYRCPSGGIYQIGNAGIVPVCNYTNICYTHRFDWTSLRLERRAWTHSLEP